VGVVKPHAKRVMGLNYEAKLGYLYSIGEDGVFTLTDTSALSKVIEIHPDSAASLKTMLSDKKNQRLILGDGSGTIFIYSIAQHPPALLCKAKTQNSALIRSFCVDQALFYLVGGDFEGGLSVFELGQVGRERFIK